MPIGNIRLQTLMLFRWIAISGQAMSIFIVYFVLHYNFTLAPIVATIGVSLLLNIYLIFRYPAAKRLNETEAISYLVYDTLQLFMLLYLTGGLHNPFSFLMITPSLVSATVLRVRSTIMLGGLVLLCSSALVYFHLPLPWSGEPHKISHIYVLGIWSSIVICVIFFSSNVMRIASESSRLSSALMETQISLAREQRLSMIDGLATVTAHELGTPLGTISLVAKELSHEIDKDSPLAEDINLLISQSERCREILKRLTVHSSDGGNFTFHNLPLSNLVEIATQSLDSKNIEITVDKAMNLADNGIEVAKVAQPVVTHSLEIICAMENLINNAIDFANSQVMVNVGWSEKKAFIEISDDGAGFEPDILYSLGEPYISSRRDNGGMGLGVFISKTLLERTGAIIKFDNPVEGGALITIIWSRPLSFEVSPVPDDELPQEHQGNQGNHLL